MRILTIPTNSISTTHTSCNTCSSPKRMRKRPRPRNGRELTWARSMLFLHLVEGGRSEAGILLKTEGLTIVMTFAPLSTRKVPPHPGDASFNQGAIVSAGNLSYCWLKGREPCVGGGSRVRVRKSPLFFVYWRGTDLGVLGTKDLSLPSNTVCGVFDSRICFVSRLSSSSLLF